MKKEGLEPIMLAMPNALASPKLPKTMEAFDLLGIRETPTTLSRRGAVASCYR
jgi:hypothetical protein